MTEGTFLPPQTLYKFMPHNEDLKATLSRPYLWFASASTFNDPFETEGSFTYPPFSLNDTERYFSLAMLHELFVKRGDLSDIKPFPPNLGSKDLYAALVNEYRKFDSGLINDIYVNKIGVCCMVRDKPVNTLASCNNQSHDEAPHLNRLMWSHYAKGLSGVCLEFDSISLYESLRDINPSNAITFSEIKYSEERPLIDMFDFMERLYLNKLSGGDGLAMALVETKSTKSTVWAYENEFRFKALNAVKAPLSYSPTAIRAAYLGQRLTSDDKAFYSRLLKELGVHNIQEVALESHNFKLLARPLKI